MKNNELPEGCHQVMTPFDFDENEYDASTIKYFNEVLLWKAYNLGLSAELCCPLNFWERSSILPFDINFDLYDEVYALLHTLSDKMNKECLTDQQLLSEILWEYNFNYLDANTWDPKFYYLNAEEGLGLVQKEVTFW